MIFLIFALRISEVERLLIDSSLGICIGVRCLFEKMREHAVLHVTLIRGVWMVLLFSAHGIVKTHMSPAG